jgi:hypothetical protein
MIINTWTSFNENNKHKITRAMSNAQGNDHHDDPEGEFYYTGDIS